MNENHPGGIKASDADRDAVLAQLSEHFQAGRLTAAEFDDRAGRALEARTRGELSDLLRDLPSAAAAPEQPSGRPVLPPVALAGIIIAVALVIGVTHLWWPLLAVLLVAWRCTRAPA
jgi:hypothetical protein